MRKNLLLLSLLLFTVYNISFAQVSITTTGSYSQDFDALPASGSATWTNNSTIASWYHARTGTGTTIVANNGSSNAGNLYSYGTGTNTERALGSVGSGNAAVGNLFWGVRLVNNSGAVLNSITLSYRGEQWRNSAAVAQTAAFSYLVGAPTVTGSLAEFQSAGVAVTQLDFTSPVTGGAAGALDGNLAANFVNITHTITGMSIPNGSEFMLRWSDPDHGGADHGLSIDDLTISWTTSGGLNLSINDVSASEGNAGTSNFIFTVSLSSPAPVGGVTFDIGTADNTATIADNDYILNSLTGQTIAAGNSTYTFTVVVNGDVNIEPNETFFVNVTNVTGATVGDGQGQGTIINDDAGCGTTHTIAQVQGSGNTSPITGSTVTIKGIVTGRRSNGFFLQTPDALADADPNTSEGIFVFTSGAPPADASTGNEVCVAGTVTEFIPSADPNSPPQTEITAPVVTLLSTGNPLPVAIVLTAADTDPSGTIYQLEKFEGMRVQVNSLTVVAPTQGNLSEVNATSTTNGFFYGVITGIARPFREPGIEAPDPPPSGTIPPIPRYDANPEMIGVGSNSIGSAAIDVATGAVLTNVIGPLDYRSRTYTIDIDPASPPTVSNNGLTFTAVPLQTTDELTVTSFNVQRFYDNVNDPGGDVVLTATAYNNRLNKVSLAIRNVLRTPDIIGLIEVENITVLQAIANKVNNDVVAGGGSNPNYTAYLMEGNDVGLIDVGFLVKSIRVNVNSVTQYGLATTYINPNNGLPELLNDRPPLVLNGTFTGSSCNTGTITVIVNHLRSLNGVDDPVDGNRVRTKRAKQAEFLADLIQSFQTADPTANIISVGDYNVFQFNDGYVDGIGTIKGTPTAPAQVVLASPDLVNPDLTNLIDTYIASERYSYSFGGDAQVLDHILVNSNLLSKISRFSIGRLDADFPEVYRNDANRPERISDHDAPFAYILFPDVIPPSLTCPGPVTVSCASAVPAPDIATVTGLSDNCPGPITVTHQGDVISAQTCANRYTLTRTYRATDAANNFTECTQIITVDDQTAPTLTCPGPVTVSCASQVPAPNIALVTGVSDNCAAVVTVTFVSDVISGQTCANRYTITRTYRATDVCGNFAQCTQLITVNDQTAPIITCPTNITVNATAGLCSAIVTFTTTATDNCVGAVTIVSVPASGSVFPVGTTTVTSTATDVCGNSSACTFTITVVDNQPPVITCPANITVNNTPNLCSAVVNYPSPTVTDNCCLPGAIGLSQTASQTPVAGSVACNAGGFHTNNSYWRAYNLASICLSGPLTINSVQFGIELADANGTGTTQPVTVRVYTSNGPFPGSPRTLIATQVANIPDQTLSLFNVTLTTPPIVAANSILVLELFTPDGRAPVNNRFFIGSNASPQTGPSYISAADCGIVNPTDLASIGFPNMHIILNANGTTSGPNPITQIAGLPSGSVFPVGVTTNTFRATDAAGNTSTCSFTVTVVDNQAPTITCPPPITATTPAGSCTAIVTYAVTATDNCPGVTTALVSGLASGSAFPIGVTTVTWRATDAAGNISTCSFTVTVFDGQLPVITGQPTNGTVCVGSNAVFSVTATNVVSYQWQTWNGSAWVNIAGANASTLTLNAVTFSMNTNSYRVIINGLCTNNIISNFATLYVNPLPTISLQASGPLALLPAQSLTLTAVVSPGGGTYQWFKNGVAIAGATGASLANLTVDNLGTYRCRYTDLNGCVSTSADMVVSSQSSDKLYVYPNPNTGNFHVRFFNTVNEPVTVDIFDFKGARIYTKEVVTILPYTEIQVDISKMPAGAYLVKVINSAGKSIGAKGIIKQN